MRMSAVYVILHHPLSLRFPGQACKADFGEWIFLGKDQRIRKIWRDRLSGLAELPLSSALQSVAWELRKPYIDWIGHIGKRYGSSLVWWTSDIAEKNTGVSDLFLHSCYIEIARRLICEKRPGLLIIVDDWAVFLALRKYLKTSHSLSLFYPSPYIVALVGPAVSLLSGFARAFLSLCKISYKIISARRSMSQPRSMPAETEKKRVLIHTCIDEACLKNDGRFVDRYFGKLPHWLRDQGFDVVTVIWPYNLRRSSYQTFKWFRNHRDSFIIPEDFFSITDLPRATLTILRQLTIASDSAVFEDIDISWLLFKGKVKQGLSFAKIRFILYQKMVEKLRAERFNFNYFLDTFENMFVEKPIAQSIHKYYPQVQVYGFQHATISPFMLKYFLSNGQFENASDVFPDKILCNGILWRDILRENGFPDRVLALGPALRYAYLKEEANLGRETQADRHFVLVTLSLNLMISLRIMKLLRGINLDRTIRYAIKVHPMAKGDAMIERLGWRSLPENMIWAEGEMGDWLGKSICVVGSATAAVLESVLAGVPVVLIGTEGGLEFNPLGWWEKEIPMFRCCYDSAEVRARILHWSRITLEQRKKEVSEAKATISNCFHPWDETVLHALFPRGSNAGQH